MNAIIVPRIVAYKHAYIGFEILSVVSGSQDFKASAITSFSDKFFSELMYAAET